MLIWIIGFGLLAVLITLSVIDFSTMILPDVLTLPMVGAGLLFAYWQHALLAGIIGAAVGYVGLVALELFYKKITGVEGIGRGDAKLLAPEYISHHDPRTRWSLGNWATQFRA